MNNNPRPPYNYRMHDWYNPRTTRPPGQSQNASQLGSQSEIANPNMRGSSGPRQQQPQQPSVNKQSLDGMTGDQQQQQVSGAPFPQAHNPGMQYPQISKSYGQPGFNPQGVNPKLRFAYGLLLGNQTPGGYSYRNPQNPVSIVPATQRQQNANTQGIRQYVPQGQRFYVPPQMSCLLPAPSVHGVPQGVQVTPDNTTIHPSHHKPQRSGPQVGEKAVVPNQHVNRGERVPSSERK